MGTPRYWIICGVSMALALGSAASPTSLVFGAEPSATQATQQPPQSDPVSPETAKQSAGRSANQEHPASSSQDAPIPSAQASSSASSSIEQATITVPQPNLDQTGSVTIEVMQAKPDLPVASTQASQTDATQPQPAEANSSSSESQPLRFSRDPIPVSQPLVTPTDPKVDQPSELVVPPVPIADPASRPYTPPPDYLDPAANPLQFPTTPDEVKIVGTQPITLQQAIELARRNSRSLKVAELQLQSTRLALREARAAEYPSVDLNGTLSYTDSAASELSNRSRDPNSLAALLGQQNQSTTSTSLSGTIELSYNLDTSGRRSASIGAAERQVRSSELEYERQLEVLRLDVTNDYYALQEADQQVEISQQAVKDAEASLKDARALEQAGVGTKFDVLRSQVQLANAQQDLVQALSQQRISRRQLAQRLSLSQAVDISAADPVEIAGLWNLSLEESIVMAFKNRPELEQQLVQREIGDRQRDLALSAIRPQVSLFANYSVLDQFNDNIGSADGYAVGARINWNLYDGGAAVARAQQRERDIEIAETRFAETRNQIRFQVEQSYSNLRANFDNIQTAQVAVVQAQESLRLARLRFQAGVGTQTEVINSETELTRARINRLNAILDYNRALASLRRSVSNLSASGQ